MKTLEIKTKSVKKEVISPREFLSIPKSEIEKSIFIPPRLGSNSFGKFKVEYKHTRYKPLG